MSNSPHVVILAGPNGAGKSTAAPALLRDTLEVDEFVNADVIAAGLSGFNPEGAAIEAGRVMIERLNYLADQRINFSFETTLSGRTAARFLKDLHVKGYKISLLYLRLPNADFAIDRVHARVKLGGHNVPKDIIRRRYDSGLSNFDKLYRPLVDSWMMYDTSFDTGPQLLNSNVKDSQVIDIAFFEAFQSASWKHKQLGVPLVVWKDGRTVKIPPGEIVVPKVA